MQEFQQPWGIQEAEHAAWVYAMKQLKEIGINVNDVDVITFEPARQALNRWAITFAGGVVAGVFPDPMEAS
jgi:hypothetical protein